MSCTHKHQLLGMIEKITTTCRNIPRAVLLGTVQNFQQRIDLCIQ